MRIGNVEIKNNIALAPMAGVTDLPFRLLCKEQGCGLMCTEMVSAKAVLYNNKNTEDLMKTVPGERPLALQLFGSDPDIMADIAKRLSEREFDIIDVNMGCPVPKVVNNGEGSALMKDPVLVGRIVEKAVGGHGQQVFTNCLKQVFILLGVDRSDTAADGVVKGHLLEQLGLIEKDRFAALNHFRFAIDLLEQRKVAGADSIPAAQFMTVWLQRIGDFIEG